jgi:hypothetical protein
MHPVTLLTRWVSEELAERDDEVSRVAQSASMKASRRREHDPDVVLTRRRPHASNPVEVLNVLGNKRPLPCRRESKKILVRHHCQNPIVGCCEYVVTLQAEAFGRDTRVVDVEEQLHPARSCWRRRQIPSNSSAAATLAAIAPSISSGYVA